VFWYLSYAPTDAKHFSNLKKSKNFIYFYLMDNGISNSSVTVDVSRVKRRAFILGMMVGAIAATIVFVIVNVLT
tara:strand:+ start:159 stop:380 length:222 start_codon:yes stop_codon:yes gene_type:complete